MYSIISMAAKSGEDRLREMEAEMALWVLQRCFIFIFFEAIVLIII